MNLPPKALLLIVILVFGAGIVVNNMIRGSDIPVEFSLLFLTVLAIFATDFRSGLAKYRSKIFLIISAIGLVLMYLTIQGGT